MMMMMTILVILMTRTRYKYISEYQLIIESKLSFRGILVKAKGLFQTWSWWLLSLKSTIPSLVWIMLALLLFCSRAPPSLDGWLWQGEPKRFQNGAVCESWSTKHARREPYFSFPLKEIKTIIFLICVWKIAHCLYYKMRNDVMKPAILSSPVLSVFYFS